MNSHHIVLDGSPTVDAAIIYACNQELAEVLNLVFGMTVDEARMYTDTVWERNPEHITAVRIELQALHQNEARNTREFIWALLNENLALKAKLRKFEQGGADNSAI
jgi:hypothetical protein